MTNERASAVIVEIAKVVKWTDIRVAQYHDGEWDIFGIPPGADDERPLPDYYTDLKAAITAACELLEGWDIIHRRVYGVPYHALHFRWYKDGLQQVEVDSFDVLPAAICEAILQARGLVVDESSAHDSTQNMLESENTDGN